MVFEIQRVKSEILVSLSAASDHRLRPRDVERALSHRFGISAHAVHQGVRDLVEEGKLVYTYRDPCSYIEMAQGIGSI
jgi:hypothetical protein